MKFLVTGGAGFIGSALIRHLINNKSFEVLNVDKLTYAGNLSSLESVKNSSLYSFKQVDICNALLIRKIFKEFQPDVVMHLAAESHVDRSIDGPLEFMNTNILGTFVMVEESRKYHQSISKKNNKGFKFHHISTDEVYGDLDGTDALFTEDSRYDPSSPYSASKASSDHIVRSWHRTYGLPTIITNCSNNYGPFHYPEKLIPLIIINAIHGKDLPVYGTGDQVRDWLYVEDHARALVDVVLNGKIGETYNIGGHNEVKNIDVVNLICDILEELHPVKPGTLKQYKDLIKFVKDRPGHDRRYAIDASKIQNDLGWIPKETFKTGLYKTVEWYLNNSQWWNQILDKNNEQKGSE